MLSKEENNILSIKDDIDRYDRVQLYLSDQNKVNSWEFVIQLSKDDYDVIQTEVLDFLIDNFEEIDQPILDEIHKAVSNSASEISMSRLWLLDAEFSNNSSYLFDLEMDNFSTYQKVYAYYSLYVARGDFYHLYMCVREGMEYFDAFASLLNSIAEEIGNKDHQEACQQLLLSKRSHNHN